MWRPEDLSFEIEDDATSDPVVTVVFITPSGPLWMMAEPMMNGLTLVLKGLHMHGDDDVGPNSVGPATSACSPTR